MKRVLLTGATGFIGRQAIAPLLGKGYEIHAVSTIAPTADLIYENVVWHKTNLLDAAEIDDLCEKVRASHLLHFAWYVEHGKFWNAPENEIWTAASLSLLESFQKNGGERMVMAGTCAEYEWGKDAILSESKTPLKPTNFYGECKIELQKKLAASNASWAWGRVFFLYGEFEASRRLIASVINSLLRDEFADCSHGGQMRDFMYVKDVADAFVALLDSKVEGCVNIASGESVTIKEIVFMIAEQLCKSDKIRFGTVLTTSDEPPSIVADITRLREEVGWKPRFSLPQGIKETIEWWKNQ
jgi:nucleoside-diphosphate-sugar epimerase